MVVNVIPFTTVILLLLKVATATDIGGHHRYMATFTRATTYSSYEVRTAVLHQLDRSGDDNNKRSREGKEHNP